MNSTQPNQLNFWITRSFLSLLLISLSSQLAIAQFQIVGMQVNSQSGWTPVNAVNLTISYPSQQPFTEQVTKDPRKQYPSGTTFKTPANTSITVLHKGQMQVLAGNSTLKVVVLKNGVSAQTLSGQVQHVLDDVKQKVGYYRAGNGYTWAHAEGTVFTVQASPRSKSVNIQTREGRVVITDEIPVKINQQATTTGGGRDGRQLKTVVRTVNTAGQQPYVTRSQAQPKVFQTYAQAIAEFEAELTRLEYSGEAYIEELADKFALIGELYLEVGEYDRAQEPLAKAFEYTQALDPEDLYAVDILLYLAEASIYGTDRDIQMEGVSLVRNFIGIGQEALNEYIEDFKYANQIGDGDWAWDLCYDLVDLNEYLGWAHELLDEEGQADYYYQWADYYDNLL